MFRAMEALNAHELAWAAGFFDAEGNVCYAAAGRGRRRAQASLSQAGSTYPPTLSRFHDAIGGLGNRLRTPARGYLFYWYSHRLDHIRMTGTLLWPWLSSKKREQFAGVISRSSSVPWEAPHESQDTHDAAHELAWAAGFFDGEGSFAASRSSTWRVISASIPQSSLDGIPETLIRFQRAVGRGTISGPKPQHNAWSKLPRYRWSSSSLGDVEATVHMLWSHLSAAKRQQALAALERYGTSARQLANGSAYSRQTRGSDGNPKTGDPVTPPVGESPVR